MSLIICFLITSVLVFVIWVIFRWTSTPWELIVGWGFVLLFCPHPWLSTVFGLSNQLGFLFWGWCHDVVFFYICISFCPDALNYASSFLKFASSCLHFRSNRLEIVVFGLSRFSMFCLICFSLSCFSLSSWLSLSLSFCFVHSFCLFHAYS